MHMLSGVDVRDIIFIRVFLQIKELLPLIRLLKSCDANYFYIFSPSESRIILRCSLHAFEIKFQYVLFQEVSRCNSLLDTNNLVLPVLWKVI